MKTNQLSIVILLITVFLSACASQMVTPQLPASHRLETDNLSATLELVHTLETQIPTNQILVVFDIDNTLLAMNTELGSDQWYDWQKALQKEDKCDPRLVTERLSAQGALYFASSMRPTQTDAAEIIQSLQKQGVQVMAATARGWNFALPTYRELRRNKMNFEDSAPGSDYGRHTPTGAKRPVYYQDGVYLLAGQHKGDMLMNLLNKSGEPQPAAIIVIDDKDYNLDAYEETAAREGWKLYSFHYTGVRDWVESFNAEAVDADWQKVRSALHTLQAVFGDENFNLPQATPLPECQIAK